MVADARVTQSNVYSDGTTGYGGNQPSIYTSLAMSLSNSGRGSFTTGLGYGALRFVDTLKMTVTITDSSGNALQNVPVTMYDSPHDVQVLPDWLNTISMILNTLQIDYPSAPPLLYTNPAVYNGITVGPAPNYAIQGQWSLNQNFIVAAPLIQNDKLIELYLNPTFPKPDVYTFSITTYAELGACDYQPTSITYDSEHNIQYNVAWLCLLQDSRAQSFSFKYVYENDAGQGGDAGDSFATARQTGHGSLNGFLYSPDGTATDTNADVADYYSFSTSLNEKVMFSVTPPRSSSFGLSIYDSDQRLVQNSNLGTGQTNSVLFTANGGRYYANIYIVSGTGSYSFILTDTFQIAASPNAVSLGPVGTGSWQTSTINLRSSGDFSGQVSLSTSVSPAVPNGPTVSLSTVNAFATVMVSPSVVVQTYWSPSNPSYAFASDGKYASFDTANGGGSTTVMAVYGGYHIDLPPGASIYDVWTEEKHYETGDDYGVWMSLSAGGQTSLTTNVPKRSSDTTDFQDFTFLLDSWTADTINNAQVTYWDEGGVYHHEISYLDWLPMQVQYTYPVTTSTLSPGGSDSRILTITSNANTPVGSYTVTVTGTSGPLTMSTFVIASVSDFQITAPTTANSLSGQSASIAVTSSALNGFSGSMSLNVNAPSGLTCLTPTPSTFNLNPTTPSVVSSLACSGSPGSYTVTLTAASGSLQHTASVTVNIQDFVLSLTPTSQTVIAKTLGNFTINLPSLYGFSGLVNLTYTVPSGLYCDPPLFLVVSDPSTISCTGSGGTYTIGVKAVSGPIVHTFNIALTIQDFTVSSNPPSLSFVAGSTGTATIGVSSVNGFTGTVGLTASVPAGLTCQPLSPASISLTSTTTAGSSSLTCSGSGGSYHANVTGTFGRLLRMITLTVNVQDFSLSFSAVSPSYLLPGSSGTSTITESALGGFTGTVNLSVSSSTPPGLTCSQPSSVTFGSSPQTVSLTCNASASSDYAVTITGTSGGLSHTTGSIAFHVVDFSISRSPSSASLTLASASSISTITLTSINGFSASTTLTYSSSPAGLVLSLWPTSITPPSGGTATSTLDISAGSATPGTYTITVTGISGSTSHSTTLSITVAGDFSASASPNSVSVQQGSSTTSTINLMSLSSFSGSIAVGSSAAVTINAANVDDGTSRAFGLTIDQTLYTPDFWNQQASSVIGTTYGSFNYSNAYNLSTGSHYLEFGVSAWVGHWHAKIYVNGVLMADVDTNVMTHVHVAFQVGGNSVSPNVANGPTLAFNPTSVTLNSGGTGTLTMTVSTQSATPTGTYTFTVTLTSAGRSHSVTITATVLTPKYTLTFQGYDYDGSHEETLTLNSHQLAQLPAVDSPQNAGVYTTFSIDMTSLAVKGTNTLVFTHANWDCGVVDNTKSVVITDAAGVVIFSDPTVRPLSCTQSITYTFTI